MKRLTLLFLILLLTQSCSIRSDKIFSASDELHCITLFEEDSEFELLYNGLNTAAGKFSIEGDTIFLTYAERQFDDFSPSKKLTRKLLIDRRNQKVKSIDNKEKFCARIDFDKIKTSHNKS